MKILLHDYAGHPFQVQLSAQLAKQGHQVIHAFSASTHTPQASFDQLAGTLDGLTIKPINLGQTIPKNQFFTRLRLERLYGFKLANLLKQTQPDLVVSGNTPTSAQVQLVQQGKKDHIPVITWVQDFYGIAARSILENKGRKLPGPLGNLGQSLGRFAGNSMVNQDAWCYRNSKRVIAIAPQFVQTLTNMGVNENQIDVIANWGPIENTPVCPKQNDWAQEHQLSHRFVFMYTGTLGMKHDPNVLVALAKRFASANSDNQYDSAQSSSHSSSQSPCVVVVSEGDTANWLKQQAQTQDLDNLIVLPFQPSEVLAKTLGTADVLLTLLSPDAGAFAVPSKVLTYLCAGRPILAAVPLANEAADLINRTGAGIAIEPGDNNAFLNHAQALFEHPEKRQACGQAGRTYAEQTFHIEQVAKPFMTCFEKCL